MKLIITESGNFSTKAYNLLNSNFKTIQLSDKSKLKEHIDSVEVLFIRLGIQLNKELLTKANKLKIICSPTTGLDHIDVKFCAERGIKIISLKNEQEFLGSIPSTAEHSWTLLQAVNRNLINAHNETIKQTWNRDKFKSFNLANKTIGILGYGRVGKQIANYAKAFKMKIVTYDEALEKNNDPDVHALETPEELFSIADFISIHIPYEEHNTKFVNRDLIAKMKNNACLINTSRGKIWDEEVVANALVNGKIRGVATDVVCQENSKNIFSSPLFEVDTSRYNCIITPHIAGATYDSMKMTEEFIAEKLLEYVNR
mgnify:CR=1 FL=1